MHGFFYFLFFYVVSDNLKDLCAEKSNAFNIYAMIIHFKDIFIVDTLIYILLIYVFLFHIFSQNNTKIALLVML